MSLKNRVYPVIVTSVSLPIPEEARAVRTDNVDPFSGYGDGNTGADSPSPESSSVRVHESDV